MAALAAALEIGSPSLGRAADPAVKVLEHTGRWESGYGEKFYNVVGKLRNDAATAVVYVKLRIDGLDAAGKVVATTDAYNEGAEALTLPGANLEKLRAAGKVKPLAAGATERFRASFLKDDAPGVTQHRVVVVEAPAVK
jgi:hypothetical protein